MRPLRLLLSLTSCVLAITFLLYVSVSDPSEPATDHDDSDDRKGGLGNLFSFHGPLFPPSAIISLTDDNSTFFLARPAAFGPLLPSKGLSGQLWIGSGFANDAYAHDGLDISSEGELGCSDVPGWNERFETAKKRHSVDEMLNSEVKRSARQKIREAWRSWSSRSAHYDDSYREETTPHPQNDDAQGRRLRESAEISGKIVLLSRGGCGFLEKVNWAQRRGGVAVIIGDNQRGGPIITMYARGDTSNVTIPALFTSRTTAHLLSTLVPLGGSLGAVSEADADMENGSQPSSDVKAKALSSHTIEPTWPVPTSTPQWRPFSQPAAERPRSIFSRIFASLFGYPRSVDGESSASDSLQMMPERQSESIAKARASDWQPSHSGLWVTLTPTNMSSNPFLDTLLVLVVSPLVTLTVVYALLLLRSRMQRRRWRAPKSVVERLPVRTYHTLSSSSSQLATPIASSPTTPLLQSEHRPVPRSPARTEALDFPSSSDQRHHEHIPSDHEKRESGLAEWRRRYGGRQRECVVCLEEYVDGVSRVMSLPCGHEFHAECITPWLTTRRRTCPICKGDVVRSLARHNSTRSRSPSPIASPHTRRQRRRRDDVSLHGDEDSSSEGSVSDEDIPVQAAMRRNDSPSAAMSIPTAPDSFSREIYDEDPEQGAGPSSAPEVRGRTGRSTLRQTLGTWGLPRLGTIRRDEGRRTESNE